ncbi:MAG: hypothetical protein JXA77_07640 [Bacteroidales bacterium]|nr:hypothetical protein [Bacteroidales bacterium]MBN2821421.1 hypothetical protein [Bacteroidales bacterium]
MKTKHLQVLLISVLFISSLSSCKKKTESSDEVKFTEEIAEYVNYVTAGSIYPDQPVYIEFNNAVVSSEMVGKDASSDILKISPSTKGKLVWESSSKLVFTPDENWKMREHYDAQVFLNKISADMADIKDELSFTFVVEGQEVQYFKGELVLKERNNPKFLKYIGKVTFKLPVTINELEQGVKIKGGKNPKLLFTGTGDNYTYTFESEDIVREDKSQSYDIIIAKSSFGLSDNYTDNFEVTPLTKMLVKSVAKEEGGQHPRIKVVFSDDIETSQDISGYFSVSPDINLKVTMSGNTAIGDGGFKYGESYELSVKPGIKSRWATVMEKENSYKLRFSDLPPSIEFASDGIIMPTSNNSKIQFMSSNVSRVHLQVKQVFSNRVLDFVRQDEMDGGRKRHNSFNRNYNGQLGVILLNKTLDLGDVKNEWLLSEIDLSDIIKSGNEGFYLVRLNFNPRDMMVEVEQNEIDYIADNGEVYKPLVVSNLGITAKKEGDTYQVFVTDLLTTKPVSGATVSVYRYWNDNSESTKETNSDGQSSLYCDYGASVITAKKNGQISYLKLENMEWNTSGFDVEGVSTDRSGLRAFIYTERGVYRPGDEINLSAIIRNQSYTFPAGHPVSITVFNPDGQNVYEESNSSGKDGFYSFNFKTNDSDPTGNWEVRLNAGSKYFYHTLKIETVVPYKLKVKMETDKSKIGFKDTKIDYTINSSYLFGAPAADLKYEAEVEVMPRKVNFPKYTKFNFDNDFINFHTYTKKLQTGKLDSLGNAGVSWIIPQFEKVPSGLSARFISTVFEKGGRPNINRTTIPIDNYEYYVGLEKPTYWYHYVATNEESSLQVVCLDNDGNPAEGKKITYRIYQNTSHWWYHYSNRSEYQLRYKTDNNTTLVYEGSVVSKDKPVNIKYTPREDGDYLVEVQVGGQDGHSVSQFVYAYQWGSVPSGDQNAGTLMMKADKQKYNVGDIAKIKFPAPKEASVLYTLERENDVVEWKWLSNTAQEGEDMEISIPVTSEMVPNTYLTISVIQPHEQTKNDRPMRMFGILPILAEDPETRQGIDIIVAEELEPKKPFNVTIQTADHKKTQFTIAVVDEGLLDLTNFQTPNPWKEFFKKLRLGVSTYDLFSQIIGVNKGDVFKTFSIGGDMDFRQQQLNPEKGKKRFKPVSMFKGPLMTDGDGRATVSFNMPEYNGSVRIMVVSANSNTYGNAEKAVPVRTDLMVEPSIPRVLGPGESFVLPVSVFAMKENIGKVEVSIKTEGPIEVVGEKTKSLNFTKATDKDLIFKVNTINAAGQAKIVVTASSSKMKAESITDIMVRPSAPRQYATESKKIKPGESAVFTIPDDGMAGTNNAQLKIEKFPNLNFNHRLEWLIRYPYGCIEQTTSAVFPQLYLKSFIEDDGENHNRIDKNIDAGIERLIRFQTSSGAMSYWPGGDYVSEWATIYAAHFLISAKGKGYHVPDYLYDNLLNYLERKSRYGSDDNYIRVYRAYVLSSTDKNIVSELNRLRQDQLSSLNFTQKYLLAAAFYNAGKSSTASEIMSKVSGTYATYDDFNYHYGSTARDMGFVLNTLIDMKDDENARVQAEEIARLVSSRDWYSTHSLGYMLLSLGRYFDGIGLNTTGSKDIKGYYLLDGKKYTFGPANRLKIDLKSGFGKELQVFIDSDAGVQLAYTDLDWNGVPLKDTRAAESKRIELEVEWLNEDGRSIDPSSLKQAQTIFGHYKVKNASLLTALNEIALVQIIPTGWEIENMRLSGDQLPAWTSNYKLNQEEYTDIRDDRIMWFFDIGTQAFDFIVKINVVTQGEFYLPPTVCEAMYSNNYYAIHPGMDVKVTGAGK